MLIVAAIIEHIPSNSLISFACATISACSRPMDFGNKHRKSSKAGGAEDGKTAAPTSTKKVRDLPKCDPNSSTSTMATDLTYLDDSMRTSSSTLETTSTTNICSSSSLSPSSSPSSSCKEKSKVAKDKSNNNNNKADHPRRVKYPSGTRENIQINSSNSKFDDTYASKLSVGEIMRWKTSSLPSASHLPAVMMGKAKGSTLGGNKLTCSVSNLKRTYDKNHNVIDSKVSLCELEFLLLFLFLATSTQDKVAA